MKESYLHHIFQTKYIGNQFITTTGETLEILNFGDYNLDAGPDFSNVRIRYDNKIWIGPLEFHVRSSDWFKHNHQVDEKYNNVIAHFVFEHDREVRINHFQLPTVELKNKIDFDHYLKFKQLTKNQFDIPCQTQLVEIDKSVIKRQIDEAFKLRLNRKSKVINQLVLDLHGDLYKALFILLARSFGGKINALPFEKLVKSVDFKWLAKINYDDFQSQALFLGLAGLLTEKTKDPYVLNLQSEFQYLKVLFNLDDSVQKYEWKYSTMRPTNFPDIRLVQFVGLLNKMLKIPIPDLTQSSISEIKSLLDIEVNSWWNKHYRLVNETNEKSSKLSNTFIELQLINTFLPFQYALATRHKNTEWRQKVIQDFQELKPEKNKITKAWENLGLINDSAFTSQALIEMKNQFCNQKKCLFCAMGKAILNR